MAWTRYEKMINFYVIIDSVPTLEEVENSKKCGEYLGSILILSYLLLGSTVWTDWEKYFFSGYAIVYWFIFANLIYYIVGRIIGKHMYIYYKEIYCKDMFFDDIQEFLIYYGIALVIVWIAKGRGVEYIILAAVPIGEAKKIKGKMETLEDKLKAEKMQNVKKKESGNIENENSKEEEPTQKYCPRCKAEVMDGQVYCTNCGEKNK